jgi:hypothetical protein
LYTSFIYALTQICFGTLRAIEVEQLTERAWFAITETCLAMTIFREEIGAWFLVMFTALVTGKVWGWIGDGRVDFLEQQPPTNPRLFHLRLSISLAASFIYDIWILRYTVLTVIQQARPNMMVMFLFEFAILATNSMRTGFRYLVSVTEQRILELQTRKLLAERKTEISRQRDEIIRQREAAAAAGEPAPENEEPLPNPDDIDEMDIEVPGWSAKGELILWLDLLTGKRSPFPLKMCIQLQTLTSITRLCQAGNLHLLLHDASHVLWPPDSYYARLVHDDKRLLEETQRASTLQTGYPRDEQIRRCDCARSRTRKHMHHLPRGNAFVGPCRECRCCRPNTPQETSMRPHSTSWLPQELAGTTAGVPDL